jgi:PHP family Zn ribbon phosphoesterase
MAFYADLHIHSKYSRATSPECNLEHLSYWARRKGVTVLGTGDFTHPVWRREIKDKLVPAEHGLFRSQPELESLVENWLDGEPTLPTRFMLEVEISTIYKKKTTRRVKSTT